MAKFQDFEILSDTRPQTAWKELKDLLLDNESVEVIIQFDDDDNPVAFWLRVWDDVRQDESNEIFADPNLEY